jgi:hypothetical protein
MNIHSQVAIYWSGFRATAKRLLPQGKETTEISLDSSHWRAISD